MQDKRFLVRANIWKVPEKRVGYNRHEKRLYSYEAPHDHNSNFLTVGLYGPGYETEMWQYQYEDGLKPGDKVDHSYLGRKVLGLGDIMYYEKSKDINSQLAPLRPVYFD